MEAFEGFLAALRRPKGDDDEVAARRQAIRDATVRATEVPLATLEASVAVLALVRRLVDLAKRVRLRAEADLGGAVELAHGAFRVAEYNIRVNLPGLGDDPRCDGLRGDWESLRISFAQSYDELRAALGDEPNPLAERTRSRRTVWHSREQIIESYGAREPYGTWTQEALEAYISAGCFERPDGMVELLCPGRIEAQVYEQAPMFDALSHLSRLELPCLVVRGQTSGSFPEERAAKALAVMTDARLVTVADTTHFVPMERPDELARLIACEIDA